MLRGWQRLQDFVSNTSGWMSGSASVSTTFSPLPGETRRTAKNAKPFSLPVLERTTEWFQNHSPVILAFHPRFAQQVVCKFNGPRVPHPRVRLRFELHRLATLLPGSNRLAGRGCALPD